MEITLTPELDAWVQERVRIGDFKNAHDAVVTAVALLQSYRDDDWPEIPEWHKAEIKRALDEEERGGPDNFFPSDEEILSALEMAGVDRRKLEQWVK